MIIQTGMRTDIPAFYSKWFLNRIREGYVLVRNPYNPSQVTKYSLSPEVIRIADRYEMTVRPCAEGNDLEPFGADCSGCMTVNTFESALHSHLDVPKRKSNQRNGQCACLLGVDIGAYDTCGHLCRYCYANTNAALVKENMRKHDPSSPFLLGGNMPGDIIHKAQQKSWIDGQMRLEISGRYTDI